MMEFLNEMRDTLIDPDSTIELDDGRNLNDIVKSKLFPFNIPSEATYPYITIRGMDINEKTTIGNKPLEWAVFPNMDFWVYSEDPQKICDIQKLLRKNLHRASFKTDNYSCRNILLVNSIIPFQPNIDKYPEKFAAYQTYYMEVSYLNT